MPDYVDGYGSFTQDEADRLNRAEAEREANIALDEAYAMGLLPPRRKLPVPRNLAYAMRWGDAGFFMLAFWQVPKREKRN